MSWSTKPKRLSLSGTVYTFFQHIGSSLWSTWNVLLDESLIETLVQQPHRWLIDRQSSIRETIARCWIRSIFARMRQQVQVPRPLPWQMTTTTMIASNSINCPNLSRVVGGKLEHKVPQRLLGALKIFSMSLLPHLVTAMSYLSWPSCSWLELKPEITTSICQTITPNNNRQHSIFPTNNPKSVIKSA